MAFPSPTRIIALFSVLLLLGAGGAEAGHHHDEDADVGHDCAWCETQAPGLFLGVQAAPSVCSAAPSRLPGPQGPPTCARYRNHLLSRAPPVCA